MGRNTQAWARAAVLGILLLSGVRFDSRAQVRDASARLTLEQAVAALRHIEPARLTEAQKEAKTDQIEAAWAVIRGAGPQGRERLMRELRQIETARGRDDFFKLCVAALLWDMGGLNEAAGIAAIWSSTPLDVHYNYVFYPAFEAAQTQDARALPMLSETLKDDKGRVFLYQHAMHVRWPLTHEFIWGSFGPKGLPRLAELIRTSTDETAVRSAVVLLSQAQYLGALPRIREIARSGAGDARLFAIRALGSFGHPQDYDLLIAGLRAKDPKELFSHVYALYEYDDLRAVPHLIPLLEAEDKAVRRETFAALTHLLTSESIDALHRQLGTTKDPNERAAIEDYLNTELKEYGLTLAEYQKKSPQERASTAAMIRRRREGGRFSLGPGEKGLTRAELLLAAKQWKEKHRLTGTGIAGRVEPKHILAGATPADIELLLEVKAALYTRLSDECLYETRRIDAVVKHLGRRRYRREPGISEKVEAL